LIVHRLISLQTYVDQSLVGLSAGEAEGFSPRADHFKPHQLAFRNPGIFPASANSRSMIRETLNFRRFPRLRPVSMHRKCERVGDESRGSFASAAKFFSFFSFRRSSAYFRTSSERRFCFAIQALVAILVS
jgi:hypothetical protein